MSTTKNGTTHENAFSVDLSAKGHIVLDFNAASVSAGNTIIVDSNGKHYTTYADNTIEITYEHTAKTTEPDFTVKCKAGTCKH